MHMRVHAAPEGEPSVTLLYLLVCGLTWRPLLCSGTEGEKHTCVAESHISLSWFCHQGEVLQPVDDEVLPTLPCFPSSLAACIFFLTKSHLLHTHPLEKRD